MTSQFKVFASAVRRRFAEMEGSTLYIVAADRDKIWEHYLKSFPPGTDPIFRKRSEHDCSCCRGFIRNVGPLVTIQNGALSSVWDLNGLPEPYQSVADGMSAYVKSLPVRDVFLTKETRYGVSSNNELSDGKLLRWDHFSVEIPDKYVNRDFVAKQGELRTTQQVLLRGLVELHPDAVETVADLISSAAIYRGAEHKAALDKFQRLQQRFGVVESGKEGALLTWEMVNNPVARFRNTVIGTLVQDLSEGKPVEEAVKMFESKVAPESYKRPTALITKGMVTAAMKTIQELDLEPALARRHARLSDVSVNSVLFVDNAVRGKMKDGIEGLLLDEVVAPVFDPKRAENISINDFLLKVVPRANAINLYLENSLQGHFVSMTAPVDPTTQPLFRWDNSFAWSYDGNVTDSIKERVKRAGGKVEGVALRVSLAWSNTDDLDLHVIEPNGNHISFANKSGKLDVDMNVYSPLVRNAVENVRWLTTKGSQGLMLGKYTVYVNNYRKRESTDVGFEVEIESAHGLQTLGFDRALPDRHNQVVATIEVGRSGQILVVPDPGMIVGASSQEKWGLKTLDLVRVNSIVLSPNHWDGRKVGNKHWFFILEGCLNPEPTRGIYNEFLAPGLEKHRKVFEVLGDKTKCPVSDQQMSGVGFSSTKEDKVTVVAMGPNLNKAYTIHFGKVQGD